VTEVVGTILNRIVVSANGGMPAVGCTEAFGKWVPMNAETKFAFLSDVIPVGNYITSIGDLFFMIGIALSMIGVWIVVPQGRKFFPQLIASVIGIFWSTTVPDCIISTFLFEIAAIGTLFSIYFQRSAHSSLTS